MIEQLGKHSDWKPVEQRGNPVANPLGRGYLSNAQEEKRRGGVSMKAGAPTGGGPVAKVSQGHAATRGHSTGSGRTLRDGSGRGDVLRRIPHDEARFFNWL